MLISISFWEQSGFPDVSKELPTLSLFHVLKDEYYSIISHLPCAISHIHFFTIELVSTTDDTIYIKLRHVELSRRIYNSLV